jgi:hypothetical protein
MTGTAVRHGNKDSLVKWLTEQGVNLTVVEGCQADLQSLQPSDQLYGHLVAGCKILLVEAGGGNGKPTRFWHITTALADSKPTEDPTEEPTEPFFYPLSSQFGQATEGEKQFLISLCDLLAIYPEDRSNADSMKESINLYLVNQVGNWAILDKDTITQKTQLIFKRLCSASAFIRDRKGMRQIEWLKVLESHVKLITVYNDILTRF